MDKKIRTKPSIEEVLSHYINWALFKKWLEQEKFVFGGYLHWEDKTDVNILNEYAKEIKKQVRAMCFLDRTEDIHDSIYHWKNYAEPGDVIRVDFDKKKLLAYLEQKKINTEKYAREVEYPETKELKEKAEKRENWPFLKRVSYKADREFRILCVGNPAPDKNKPLYKDYPLKLDFKKDWFKDCIKRITVSPSFNVGKFLEVRDFLVEYGIKEVYRSKIFRYKSWEKTLLNSST